MQYTTLTDFKYYLTDLLENPAQRATLESLHSSRVFVPALEKHLSALRALPPALTHDAQPLADELREADADHDKALRALALLLDAYASYPHEVGSPLGEQARTLKGLLVPSLAVVQSSYLDEAREAERRAERLQGSEALLDLFPVAGGTLRTWYERVQASAQRLAALLAQRAQANVDNLPNSARSEAAALRGTLQGALQQFRQTVRFELAQRPDLPPDTEARLFRFLDESSAKREAAHARTSKDEPPKP